MDSEPSCILLDVEGTTSSIQFVYDQMFPYVRRRVADWVAAEWGKPTVSECLPLLAADLGHESAADWLGEAPASEQRGSVVAAVLEMMDQDAKRTGLKELQGRIWKSGFESGELVAHLYPDVVPALRRWTGEGRTVWIYSSGSVQAQQLFFGHTGEGDLLPLLSGHFDTTIGGKREAASYRAIANEMGVTPDSVLFVSDVPAELDAAREAGMQVALSVRPGNAPVENEADYPVWTAFPSGADAD